MTLEEMKKRKQELGYSNQTIAERSGVPFGTVHENSERRNHPRSGAFIGTPSKDDLRLHIT